MAERVNGIRYKDNLGANGCYSSIASISFKYSYRMDDFKALFYLLSELASEYQLPWTNLSDDEDIVREKMKRHDVRVSNNY